MAENLDLVLSAKSEIGEGPVWDFRRHALYWVDIPKYLVHIYDPATGVDRTINVGQEVGCVCPRRAGGLILGMKGGFATLDIESETCRLLFNPENRLPHNRFNDGKCDPMGRFWAGTISTRKNSKGQREKGAGSLYCLYPDMTVRTMATGLTTSNGMAWSPDAKTLYFIDSSDSTVYAFDYDVETGDITNRKALITIPATEGKPDGMTIDEEGMLWIAHWGGGKITRWEPAGARLVKSFKLPVPQVSSCAFGGLHLDELYITSARIGLTEEELKSSPHSGALFRVKPGVKGRPEPVFAG